MTNWLFWMFQAGVEQNLFQAGVEQNLTQIYFWQFISESNSWKWKIVLKWLPNTLTICYGLNLDGLNLLFGDSGRFCCNSTAFWRTNSKIFFECIDIIHKHIEEFCVLMLDWKRNIVSLNYFSGYSFEDVSSVDIE